MMINNARITKDALLVKVQDGKVVGKMSMQQWRAVLDVNLTGVFLEPAEMAHAAIFIAQNDYFSGRAVEVDGGQRI